DLHAVDLLHAADVSVTPGLVRVDERTALLETRAGIHDLVAVHLAAAARHLLVRVQRKRLRLLDRLGWHLSHCRHVARDLQDLTLVPCGGSPAYPCPVARGLYKASLALTPAVLIVHYGLDADGTLVFVLAALALVPLAILIGEATEHV